MLGGTFPVGCSPPVSWAGQAEWVVGVMGILTRHGAKQVQGPSREKQKEMEPETRLEIWL